MVLYLGLCAGHHVFMTDSPDRLHASFQEAFNCHDLDAIVALYEPDALYTGGGEPAQGVDAIRDVYREGSIPIALHIS
jgi:ketosteroid isomerase-like protein